MALGEGPRWPSGERARRRTRPPRDHRDAQRREISNTLLSSSWPDLIGPSHAVQHLPYFARCPGESHNGMTALLHRGEKARSSRAMTNGKTDKNGGRGPRFDSRRFRLKPHLFQKKSL